MDVSQLLEQRIKKNAVAIQELTLRIEDLDREIDSFFEELQVTPQQLTTFIENEKNFTDSNWKEIVKNKKAFEEKLERELKNVRNPKKIQKKLTELNVPRHWIAVR